MPAHHGLMPRGRDLVGQRHHLVPASCGTVQPVVLEHLRRVPDERLHVRARAARRRTCRRPCRSPSSPSPNHLSTLAATACGASTTLPVATSVLEQAGLRDDRDVRRVAALDADQELRLELLVALVLDLGAGAGLEQLVRVLLRPGPPASRSRCRRETFLPVRSPNWVSCEHSALPSPGDLPPALLLLLSLPPQPASTRPALTRAAVSAAPLRTLRERITSSSSPLGARRRASPSPLSSSTGDASAFAPTGSSTGDNGCVTQVTLEWERSHCPSIRQKALRALPRWRDEAVRRPARPPRTPADRRRARRRLGRGGGVARDRGAPGDRAARGPGPRHRPVRGRPRRTPARRRGLARRTAPRGGSGDRPFAGAGSAADKLARRVAPRSRRSTRWPSGSPSRRRCCRSCWRWPSTSRLGSASCVARRRGGSPSTPRRTSTSSRSGPWPTSRCTCSPASATTRPWAWRTQDPDVVRRLATLELRDAGLAPPPGLR